MSKRDAVVVREDRRVSDREPVRQPDMWESHVRHCRIARSNGDTTASVRYYVNTAGMELAWVPAGTFRMGDDLDPEEVDRRWPGYPVEMYRASHPCHTVRITRGFFLGSVPVTRGQWSQFADETGHTSLAERRGNAWAFQDDKVVEVAGVNWSAPLFDQTDEHPVVCISWGDASEFCDWLSAREGLPYRLPAEAEWEYAARAGEDGATWYWGSEESGAQGRANVADEGTLPITGAFRGVKDGCRNTSSVGRFVANGFGLHDMIGNVWEWCQDWFGPDYYRYSPGEDPNGPDQGTSRVVRGGSWLSLPQLARAAARISEHPDNRNTFLGFRVVCDGVRLSVTP